MRISDWSSDVCSSDLTSLSRAKSRDVRCWTVSRLRSTLTALLVFLVMSAPSLAETIAITGGKVVIGAGSQPIDNGDRTRVVEGTSVCVRVDLEGRPII